jgi:hypothetical protein
MDMSGKVPNGGATSQRDDERADELPGGGTAQARTGAEAVNDGSCKHDKAMKYGCDTKTEEERGRRPRSPRRCGCGSTTTVGAIAGGRGHD